MKENLRLLLVEDSQDDCLLLLRELKLGGFDVQHERVDSAEGMDHALQGQPWDIVVCDYSMPHFNGAAALQLLKSKGLDIPFIYVSGTIGEEAAVEAMRVGANDYIMKGNMKRLVPAIARELREAEVRKERKRAEEALRHSEARYRAMIDNAIYGICRADMQGRFEEVNPALVNMLGYGSREELMAAQIDTQIYRDPNERLQTITKYQKEGRFEGLDAKWKRKDGNSILVRLSGLLLMDAAKNVQGVEFIVEDVTHQRAMEQQIGTLQKFEAIGQLAGGIAHDFNNVMGAIMGWAEIGAGEAPDDSSARELFLKIQNMGKRSVGLTRQLLTFARRQILESRKINVNDHVAETLGFLQKLIGEHIEVKMVLAPDLRLVQADPSQIEQVLFNLCLNARDAMPHGGQLIIETRNADFDDDDSQRYKHVQVGQYVLLQITDTGTGMNEETLAHMFEPFFTTKEVGKGTGLGLATVYGIVKQHNGFTDVYSEVGKGTTFRVYLPAIRTAVEPVRVAEEAVLRGGKEMILVAEDFEGLREMADKMLKQLGYKVVLASDGEEAMRLFMEHKDEIDLVLLDVVMPKMMGVDVFAEITKLNPKVPVILTTGYSAEIASLNNLSGKGVPILLKPYSLKSLGVKIREMLD